MTCHHGGGSPCDRRDCQTLFGLLRIRSPRRDVWPYVHVDVDVGVDVDVDVGVRVCGHGQTCLYLPCGIRRCPAPAYGLAHGSSWEVSSL